MINIWSQLTACFGLSIMALIIHVLVHNDGNVGKLDFARYYTMTRDKGDSGGARYLLESEQGWLKEACRVNLSKAFSAVGAGDECIQLRIALRNGILDKMKCLSYNSQSCAYLRTITAGIIQNKTISGTITVVGRSLVGTVPGQGSLTYRQLLLNAVDNAQLLFHNSYRAAQDNDYFVFRTILYNLVVFTIFANMVVHYLDTYEMSWTRRLLTRILVFSFSSLLSIFVFLSTSSGNTITTLVGIWLPALFVLVYFEAFLDHTVTRPW